MRSCARGAQPSSVTGSARSGTSSRNAPGSAARLASTSSGSRRSASGTTRMAADRREGGIELMAELPSVPGDRSELIRRQAPTSLLIDPHAEHAVLAARFLAAVPPLQGDPAGGDGCISVDVDRFDLARGCLDSGSAGLEVLEALLLGEERSVGRSEERRVGKEGRGAWVGVEE